MAPKVRLRAVGEADREILWRWANDPEVRANSFHPEPIPWENHVRWFGQKLQDGNCVFYLASDEQGHALGQVRFDLDEKKATISISLDAGFRGRGFGAQTLLVACREFFGLDRSAEVHAWVKAENEASLRAFRNVGFADHATEVVNGCRAQHLILKKQDLPA